MARPGHPRATSAPLLSPCPATSPSQIAPFHPLGSPGTSQSKSRAIPGYSPQLPQRVHAPGLSQSGSGVLQAPPAPSQGVPKVWETPSSAPPAPLAVIPRDPAAPGAAPAPPQPLEFSLPPSPVPAELSQPELPQSCCHSDADTEQGPALAPRVPDYPRVTARLQHLQAILKCFFSPPIFSLSFSSSCRKFRMTPCDKLCHFQLKQPGWGYLQ